MLKERLTGKELQKRLEEMSPVELLHMVVVTVQEAIPVLSEQPQDERWSAPAALVFLCKELAKRYGSYLQLEKMAEELAEKVQNHALRKMARETPDKDKV